MYARYAIYSGARVNWFSFYNFRSEKNEIHKYRSKKLNLLAYLCDALLDGGCGGGGLTDGLENLLQTSRLRAPRRHFSIAKEKRQMDLRRTSWKSVNLKLNNLGCPVSVDDCLI